MSRVNVLSGQVFGKVDWVTQDGREIGMFLRTSERGSTRCVLRGAEVEKALRNGIVQKGMMVTAHGELYARSMKRNDDGSLMAEIVCIAARVIAEAPRENRLRGVIYANLKGVAMHWDPDTMQLKTFFNYSQENFPTQVTCSLHMKSWIEGMSEEGQARFKATMRVGREFVTSAMAEVSCYRNKNGDLVPSLLLLPTDFKLQA